ncbi:glutamate--cysteine ligase [Nonomuraea sp. NPDC050328]|uniref:glutamate--cysteine ligase n=1 Tax=Nonomuraea sp. NPDC050328 TaxID=3364361 RepID=UPI00378F4DFB
MTPLIGIEEEYLVVDPATRHVTPRAAEVLAATSRTLDLTHEITKFQIEARTPPTTALISIGHHLRAARKEIARAARECGLAVVASGIPVLGEVAPAPLTEGARYDNARAVYRALHDEISICALHVHIDVPSPEHAVYVGNHLRPWLPTLLALAANSPYFAGRDTGYASWRAISWSRWPVAGAPPYFASYADYQAALTAMARSGALMDPKTVFWDCRPSPALPTVEIRVADVPLDVNDSLVLIGLIRALVVTALDAVARGDLGPPIPAELVRAAYWRAARDGTSGSGLDLLQGDLLPAAALAHRLFDHVRHALDAAGDLEFVEEGLDLLILRGSGATRQRRAHSWGNGLTGVVDDLIEATVA